MFSVVPSLSLLQEYLLFALLGVFVGGLAKFFTPALTHSLDWYVKNLAPEWRAIGPLFMAGALLFIMPEILGGGAGLVDRLAAADFTAVTPVWLLMLGGLFFAKFFFTVICFGSGVPGGIFLPLLVLGSISGGLFAEAISPICGFEEHYIGNFVILGMAGYFSAIVRAPITGIILISEMTGSFNNLLALSIVSLVAYMTAEMLKGVPIYDQLLDRMLEGGVTKKPRRTNKVLIESEVYLGAPVEGMSLAQLNLPEGCLVVSIIRDEKEIVPNGATVLETHDKLVILCDEYFAGELEEILDSMCKTMIQP